jgi:hypothetical protein
MAGHFTAAWFDATHIDLSGGFPSIDSPTQFVEIKAWDAAGAYIGAYAPETHVFDWNDTLDRVEVAGAAFVTGGELKVSILGPDRTQNRPGDFVNIAEVAPYELNSDDVATDLLPGGAQDFTAGWVDLSTEIAMFGYNTAKFYLDFDINDSTDLQFRVVEKDESGGVTEFKATIESPTASSVPFEPGYWELNVDADDQMTLMYKGKGNAPFIQAQIKAGTLGAGTDAQLDGAGVIRGTFAE